MSIQFRSRINNYRPVELIGNETGFCCSTDSSGVLRSQCPGGVFVIGATNNSQCPTIGSCPSGQLIGDNGACCYWKKQNNNYMQVCENTETPLDCLNKNEGGSQNLYASHYRGRSCISEGGDVVCNGIKNYTEDYSNCFPDGDQYCYDPAQVVGTCCEDSACFSCIRAECAGTWVPPKNGIVYGCSTERCNSILKPQNRTPPSISGSVLATTTDELLVLPEIGAYYQGGIYVGTFTQNTENNGSSLYGNPSTGNPVIYKTSPDITSESTSWILIADLQDYDMNTVGMQGLVNFDSSNYDGWYNTQNNITKSSLFKAVQSYKKNGFTDWYVPSRDELALYFNNIKSQTFTYNSCNLSEDSYYSSTSYSINGTQKFNYQYYMYSQTAYALNYGKVGVTNREATAKVRLFRRIYIK